MRDLIGLVLKGLDWERDMGMGVSVGMAGWMDRRGWFGKKVMMDHEVLKVDVLYCR